jgi:hypothetical protein
LLFRSTTAPTLSGSKSKSVRYFVVLVHRDETQSSSTRGRPCHHSPSPSHLFNSTRHPSLSYTNKETNEQRSHNDSLVLPLTLGPAHVAARSTPHPTTHPNTLPSFRSPPNQPGSFNMMATQRPLQPPSWEDQIVPTLKRRESASLLTIIMHRRKSTFTDADARCRP